MDSEFLFSSEQSAFDPVSPCDTSITPIFPVRASIRPQKLTQASSQCFTLTHPECLSENSDYEFRRIRQGFVYIYVENTIHDLKSRTDTGSGKWLIFRYKTEEGDQNSSELSLAQDIPFLKDPNTEKVMGGQYCFRMYTWADGTPYGPWKLTDNRVYSYAFVPRSTTKIEIAYSEERWPAKFFTEAESNPDFRSKLMISINLSATHTDFSAPLKELEQLVVDFKPNIVQDMLQGIIGPLQQYQDCHTGVKPDNLEVIAPCDHSKNNGRIVMLHDNMGNILDVTDRIDNNNKQRIQFNREYQYPLTIARCVKQIKPILDDANPFTEWWNDGFVVEQDVWEEKLLFEKEYEATANNLLQLHANVCSNEGAFSLSEHLIHTFILAGKSLDPLDSDVIKYATSQLNQAFEGIGNSIEGSNYQVDNLLAKGYAEPMGKVFKEAFSAWAKLASSLVGSNGKLLDHALGVATEFNSFLMISGPELGKLKYQYTNPEFMAVLRDLYGYRETSMRPLTTDEVIEFMTKGHRAGASSHVSTRSSNKAIRRAPTVNVPHVDIHGQFLPTVDFYNVAQAQTDIRIGAGGFSIFLGAFGIYSIIDQKDQPEAKTTLGKIGQHFYANLIVGFGTFVQDVYDFRKLVQSGDYSKLASKNVTRQLYRKATRLLSQPKNLTSRIGNGFKAISGRNVLKFGGKALGVIGTLFTACAAYEGFKTDNDAKGWGNSLAVLGSILLFFGPVGIALGLVMIVIGVLIELFGTRNPVEDWAYRCFWGQSDEYWGEENERISIPKLLEGAKALSDTSNVKHKAIKSFFETEVRTFEDLFTQLQLREVSYNGTQFSVFLPRYTEEGSSPEVTVNVMVLYNKIITNGGYQYSRSDMQYPKNVTTQINSTTGVASVDISELLQPEVQLNNITRVLVDVDYKDPTGKQHQWGNKPVYRSPNYGNSYRR